MTASYPLENQGWDQVGDEQTLREVIESVCPIKEARLEGIAETVGENGKALLRFAPVAEDVLDLQTRTAKLEHRVTRAYAMAGGIAAAITGIMVVVTYFFVPAPPDLSHVHAQLDAIEHSVNDALLDSTRSDTVVTEHIRNHPNFALEQWLQRVEERVQRIEQQRRRD